jgi:hypothetical protein
MVVGRPLTRGALAFYTANATDTPIENMRLDYTGNLGLGTTSPIARFEVDATSTATNIPLLALRTPTLAGFATSTVFQVDAIGSTTLFQIPSSILKTDSNGTIVAAIAGTDYLTSTSISAAFPFTPTTFGSTNANSTSTLIGFTSGIYALASSTIGDGTQGWRPHY